MTACHSPAPFPMLAQAALQNPTTNDADSDHFLPSLADSNAVFFSNILTRLQAVSSPFVPGSRTPPPLPATAPIVIDLDLDNGRINLAVSQAAATPVTPAEQSAIVLPANLEGPVAPYPEPALVKSLVFVNLQNQNSEDPGSSFAEVVDLPLNPFATQIIVAVSKSGTHIATIMGKWTCSCILVAYSRRLIPVAAGSYNTAFTGYLKLGFYNGVVGHFEEDGLVGLQDVPVPPIIENEDPARQEGC